MNNTVLASEKNAQRYGTLLAMVWLIFLVAPITTIWQADLELPAKITGWAVIAAFAICYFLGFYRYGTTTASLRQQLVVLGLLLLGCLALWPLIGAWALSLSPFAISYAVFELPLKLSQIIAPVLAGLSAIGLALFTNLASSWFLITITTLIALSGVQTRIVIELDQKAKAQQQQQALLEERSRLARDVHDLLGHSLTVIGLKTQLVEKVMDTDPARAKAELADMRAITTEALAGVRQTVDEAQLLELPTELARTQRIIQTAGATVQQIGDAGLVPASVAPALAWIVRECTTNVLRHAAAAQVRIKLSPTKLLFEDDGIGVTGQEGNGIRGIRARIAELGGRLEVGKSELGGAKLEVSW